MIRTPAALALCALALASSCNGEADPIPVGGLTVLATDAPIDPALVEDAKVWVDQVRIHADVAGSSGFHELYAGAPIELDLDDLRGGVTAHLLDADLPAGTYGQLRLRVTEARLELTNGNVYTTQAGDLDLTSQGTSGFKVLLEPPVEVRAGLDRTLVLDFDLSKTYLPIPASDPLAATSYKLLPVIHTAVLEESGILGGVVTELATSLPVEGATVYLLPPGETDTAEAVATTGSITNGNYAFLAVQAGTYDVFAVSDALEDRVDGVPVVEGILNVVDLALE